MVPDQFVSVQPRVTGDAPVIVLSANSAWYIVNFCATLIHAIQDAGYTPLVVAPLDCATEPRIRALGVDHIPVSIDRSGINPFADLRLLMAYCRILKAVLTRRLPRLHDQAEHLRSYSRRFA